MSRRERRAVQSFRDASEKVCTFTAATVWDAAAFHDQPRDFGDQRLRCSIVTPSPADSLLRANGLII